MPPSLRSRLPVGLHRNAIPARVSSLVMLFNRAPLLKLLPEARVISTSGFTESVKWAVTAIFGLGAYDSVTGASEIIQVSPSSGSLTVAGTAGQPLTFVFQFNSIRTPDHFQITTPLPPGLTHTNTRNSNTDSITGVPTQAGSFPVTIIAWRDAAQLLDSRTETFTFNITAPPLPQITSQPAGGNFSAGSMVKLVAGQTNGTSFTWKLNDAPLPAAESLLSARSAARRFIMAPTTDPGGTWRSGDPFNDSTWRSVSGGIGYDNVPGSGVNFLPFIAVGGDVRTDMLGSGKPVAVHIRIPFTISTPSSLSFLKLRVQSDDGFVAWLNGTEIASQNKPANFQWNSAASADAVDLTATTFREFDVAQHLGQLRNGDNLLAVQAMNRTNTSTDFLFNCDVVGGINTVNSPRLVLTSLRVQDSGNYTLTATNFSGSATSNPAPVLIPPSIAAHPAPTSIESGATAELRVATDGTPPFSFQWYAGTSGDTSQPVAGATADSFTTPPLTVTTSFWVRVTTSAGSADSNAATVTVVNAPPVITSQPGSVGIASGGTAELRVTANGTAPFSWQWYRGLSGDTTNLIPGATAPVFTTPPLTEITRYWVRVTNIVTSIDSETATVSVTPPFDPFAVWRNAQFTPDQIGDPLVSGNAADPDGDGVTNEREYIFGTVPLAAAPAPMPSITFSGSFVTLTFTADRAIGPGYEGLTRHYAIETADNVSTGPWSTLPLFSDIIANDQTLMCIMPAGFDKTFCRLKIWLTP